MALKVLIADDEPVARRVLESYLERWGYEFESVENGVEAWRLFRAGDFPLVLIDWEMPEMNGLELIQHIRLEERSGYVYIIMLTVKAEKEAVVQGMEAGADDFVTKPFDMDELRVRLLEGERIVKLQRELTEQNRALREGLPAPVKREKPAGTGQSSAEIDRLASRVVDNLTELRHKMPAIPQNDTLRLLDDSLEQLARVRQLLSDFKS